MTARPAHPNDDAAGELFRSFHAELEHIVRAKISHAPDAVIEDACSFAWLQMLRYEPRHDTATSWLTKVAIREAWRLAKRERRDARLDLLATDHEARHDPLDIELAHEARELLRGIAALPDRQRTYLSMLASGHSYHEIATATRTSFTAVNKHLVRARRTLRSSLHA